MDEIILPENLKIIEQKAFWGRKSLKKIIIPISVETICEDAFYGCQSLTIYCRAPEKPAGWVEELRSERFTEDYEEYTEYYWASWIGNDVA